MDLLLNVINPLVCFGIAIIIGWAILSRRVRDGILMKLAMIVAFLGFSMSAYAMAASPWNQVEILMRSILLINLSFLLALLAYWVRKSLRGVAQRRISDWMELDDVHSASSHT